MLFGFSDALLFDLASIGGAEVLIQIVLHPMGEVAVRIFCPLLRLTLLHDSLLLQGDFLFCKTLFQKVFDFLDPLVLDSGVSLC